MSLPIPKMPRPSARAMTRPIYEVSKLGVDLSHKKLEASRSTDLISRKSFLDEMVKNVGRNLGIVRRKH